MQVTDEGEVRELAASAKGIAEEWGSHCDYCGFGPGVVRSLCNEILNLRRELAWWRSVFACRFLARGLPKVGTPLHGCEMKLSVWNPQEKTWEDYTRD